MSSFICKECGEEILDSPYGYITGCEHHPLDKDKEDILKIRWQLLLDDLQFLKSILDMNVFENFTFLNSWLKCYDHLKKELEKVFTDTLSFIVKNKLTM